MSQQKFMRQKVEKLKITNQLFSQNIEPGLRLIHFNLPAIFNEYCNTPNLLQTSNSNTVVRCVNEHAEQREEERERNEKVIVNKNLTG